MVKRLRVVLALLSVCLGIEMHGAEAPQRIVSTSPGITESVFALGLGSRLVGVSTYCRYPAEATRLPKVGTFLKPDTERIARLRPDLVIVQPGPNDVVRQLSVLGIKSVAVEQGRLATVYSSIRAIGMAAGFPDRAEKLVADLTRRLDRIHASVATRPPKKVLVIVGRRPGSLTDLIAVGPGSYLHDLVAIAGGVNILGDSRLPEYPRISMETIIRLAPDVIVDAGDMGDTPEEHIRRQRATEGLWRKEAGVAAAQHDGVHPVTSDAFVVPGPRVVEAAETLAGWLHGGPVH